MFELPEFERLLALSFGDSLLWMVVVGILLLVRCLSQILLMLYHNVLIKIDRKISIKKELFFFEVVK